MLFNLLYGSAMQLEVTSGAFVNLTSPQTLRIPLTTAPIMVAFRTTVGSTSELALYYRPDIQGEFSMRVSSHAVAKCRLGSVFSSQLSALLTGASAANSASVEYYIMGVKQ